MHAVQLIVQADHRLGAGMWSHDALPHTTLHPLCRWCWRMARRVTGAWGYPGRCGLAAAHTAQKLERQQHAQISTTIHSASRRQAAFVTTGQLGLSHRCGAGGPSRHVTHCLQGAKNVFSAREFVWWYNGHPDALKLPVDMSRVEGVAVCGIGAAPLPAWSLVLLAELCIACCCLAHLLSISACALQHVC
jgi:hypothetical protein